MKVGSLFAGIGGFDLGFERAGIETVFQVEIDPACREVLGKHFPRAERFDDVRTVGSHNLPAVDVLCGGFPCTDLSVAGKREGLAGEQSGLWFEFHRVIAELAPRWVCIENVPGLLSSNSGGDFEFVLRGLVELGYGVAWRILDAQYFGLAQRRRRVFIVGCLGDPAGAAEVLFEPESCDGNPPPSREARQGVAGSLAASSHRPGLKRDEEHGLIAATLNSGGNNGGFRTEPGEHLIATYQATGDHADPTFKEGLPHLAANPMSDRQPMAVVMRNREGKPGGGKGPLLSENQSLTLATSNDQTLFGAGAVRRLTPKECERLQGFPDDWTFHSDSTRYRQLGNAVAVNVSEWIGHRLRVKEGE